MDLAVLCGKFNSAWRSQIAKRTVYGLLVVVLLVFIRQYPVDLAIQNFLLRRMHRSKASATTIPTISSTAVLVLQNPTPASCSPAKTCLGIPSSSELVPWLLNDRALNHWWKENFRVSRATFEFICRLVGPATARQIARMLDAVPIEKRVAVSLWRLATVEGYSSCGLMIGLQNPQWLSAKC